MFRTRTTLTVLSLHCLVWACSSSATAQPSPRKADRTFDANKPAQPIEGLAVPDLVIRRKGPLESGHLQSLLAFATLLSDQENLDQKKSRTNSSNAISKDQKNKHQDSSEKPPAIKAIQKKDAIPGKRIPREEISLILLDGKSLPAEPPAMPPDEDSVLLDTGEVLTGMVMVTRGTVYVGGQPVPLKQVTMIRLKVDEENDQIPAREKNDDEPPDEEKTQRELGYWVGTIRYCGIQSHEWITTAFLTVSWKETNEFPELSPEYGLSIGLENNWMSYDIVIRHVPHPIHDSGFRYQPNPYKIHGVLKNPDINLMSDYQLTTPTFEKKFPLSQYPDRWQHRQYKFKTPSYAVEDTLHWPPVRWWSKEDPSVGGVHKDHAQLIASLCGFCTWCDGKKNFTQDNDTRMVGNVHLHKAGPEGDYTFGEWDLHRVSKSPPPPETTNPKQNEDKEDCEHYRQQMEEYQSIQAKNSQLIQELADEIRETKDRLVDLGWTEKDGDVNPLESWPWKYSSQGWADYESIIKYSPDYQIPSDWSDAEVAAFNKLKRLRFAQNELFRSNYLAQMNEAYYRHAAQNCERDKANPKNANAQPSPQPDPGLQKKELGDY